MKTLTKLTQENYHSREANMDYMSVSQFKEFVGTLGRKGCEARALAKLKGEWVEEPSTAMLVGSYVDAHFEGTLKEFIKENPQMFTQKGDLKADFKRAEVVIERVSRDPMFMYYMSGEKQVIMTAEIFGVPWKIKMDSYFPKKAIVDGKVMKDLNESFYVKDMGRANFVDYWGYDMQLAIYQAVEAANSGGSRLPAYIAAADKKEFPNFEVIALSQMQLDTAFYEVESGIERVIEVKNGLVEPDRCEECDYCRDTKVLIDVITTDMLIERI